MKTHKLIVEFCEDGTIHWTPYHQSYSYETMRQTQDEAYYNGWNDACNRVIEKCKRESSYSTTYKVIAAYVQSAIKPLPFTGESQ